MISYINPNVQLAICTQHILYTKRPCEYLVPGRTCGYLNSNRGLLLSYIGLEQRRTMIPVRVWVALLALSIHETQGQTLSRSGWISSKFLWHYQSKPLSLSVTFVERLNGIYFMYNESK